MDNTTYRIVDAETETTIAYGMYRDAALDLLGMLMRWNGGVKIWMVQVDYCEEEHNRPQSSGHFTEEEQELYHNAILKRSKATGVTWWENGDQQEEDERAMVESVPNNSKNTRR